MLIFDTVTRTELDAATTDAQWASILNNALGNNRRIRCWHDANANATNPEVTGTEFRNVGSTGSLQVAGGCLAGLGTIKGTTISLAAAVNTGKSVLRMEGNGRWMMGSLGIAGSDADFTVPTNFTANNGLGIYGHFRIAGRNLPSGQGNPPPAKADNMPHVFEMWDWSNATAPVLTSTVTLTDRGPDWVYQDAELGADIGDAAWYRANDVMTLGEITFGPHLFLSAASNTSDGSAPLQEVLIAMKYNGSHTNYPYSDTYDRLNHVLNPKPFKIVMKDKNGNVLHTFAMHDGIPINDPSMGPQPNAPLRPFVNTYMLLPWWNVMPRINGKAAKYYAGLQTNFRRPTLAHANSSMLSVEPLITGGYDGNSTNSLANPLTADQWPRARTEWYPPNGDPYIDYYRQNIGSPNHAGWVEGWDYEPGSYSTHNWYTGPGGPRFDRAFMPSTLAWYLTNPNGTRPQQNVPYRDMLRGFALATCNHSNHWTTNPRTLDMGTDAEWVWTDHEYVGGYYGGGTQSSKSIYTNGGANRQDNYNPPEACDKDGHNVNNGWSRDSLHDYATAGWFGLTLASPMMAVISKWDTKTAFMLHGRPEWDGFWSYLVRDMAWHWLHHVMAWKLASNHPLAFQREDIEARFCEHLLMWYNKVYVPVYVTNDPSMPYEGLRRFGQAVSHSDRYAYWNANGGGLGHYMGGVLMLMKQTGFWHAIYSRGGKMKTVLDMVIRDLDQHAFGIFSQTGACARGKSDTFYGNYEIWSNLNWSDTISFPDGSNMPASYADLWSRMNAELQTFKPGEWSMVKQGGQFAGDPDVSVWPVIQYMYVRRDYFPELPKHPWQDDAFSKLEGYLAYTKSVVDSYLSGPNAGDPASNPDHVYCYPAVAPINPPTELGPL